MSGVRGSPRADEVTAAAVESALHNVHVAGIGIVKAYDPTTQTCSVQPAIRRPLEDEDGDLTQETPSIVVNVMVAHWGGAALSSHVNLAAGDAVLLVYLDFSPALWRQRGQVSDASDAHKNGPSYPVAIPMFRPLGAAGPDVDESIGKPDGLRVHFTASFVRVGATSDSEDFVALKSAVDAIQQNLDASASFGTPWGPTTPGNLAPAGAQASSTKLKA